MPGHQYKELWLKINVSRRERGVPELTWKEFLRKDQKSIDREKLRIHDHIEPDPPKRIIRPPAVYDNKNTYDKYLD